MTSSKTPRPLVLVALDWYLPAYRAGGPVRSMANLVEALGDDIDFRIVTGDRDLGADAPLPVRTGTWHTVGKAQVLYLSPADQTASQWRTLLAELQPDQLYLNSLFSRPFSRLPWRAARHMGTPTLLAPRGMLGQGALSIKPWRKRLWLWTQRLTRRYRNLTWHASTEAERREIHRWFPKAEVAVALNLPAPFQPLPPADRKVLRLLSVGRIHPIKNHRFGLALAQRLQASGHDVEYHIAGPLEDPAEARRLQAESDAVSLVLHGAVPPTELPAHFAAAHLVLVPSFNENFGHAVAEAVAAARPVLVSDQTAWLHMRSGSTVRCLPLGLDLWHAAAMELLRMSAANIESESKDTHQCCLLSPSHLAAQRKLFP